MNKAQRTHFVKQTAQECGFEFCGIAKAAKLGEDARRLEAWLNKGMHGTMHYMEKYFELRTDPTKLVPNAKSVITLLKNYYPETSQNTDAPKVSKYAYGNDYHETIKVQLNVFLDRLKASFGEFQGRGFVDSAPVLERAWAEKSGLGWLGKNGMLINKGAGSFYFIATLIVDVELEYDAPLAKDFCGTCTRCIDECPTDAILPNKVVDGSKCISYFTIELKDALLPDDMRPKFDNWLFGCDVCQDVCPWNRFSKPTNDEAFKPIAEILNFTEKDWSDLTEDGFRQIFKHSPLKRSKYKGIMRNLKFIMSEP
ncbi:tRNA epoxyqueuosine(34) reductase QueG [Arachidicoccus ginsenosidimutans]|uniref:tRNA epoxyqueuosine(34) reductase QueG n=1 Tax=Arachidicoccus sp. BS20 TaxID=1850526 RepID=UPI0007F1626F|nr:tRNA epoxyqueuosine(34) reductase QueG [Arachidicoccus sp. BS20]ANI87972.1 tRNA epoxyqueuosine(34) reductase QueG [Arachidicoccus sp. BS20]